ncbi:hypothetical protein NLX83_31675 [Allokutzneria sp. A3M-2-11 16]|uniref:hypothetical protein n=1 Tax=Allokutzneria sp. A3M-2-11 16 TaxID=2962043 RepID=UPI0020B8329D|nr:hypothetical protein [Allokutzneria sp. A3M-2-11 16]MCP3803838.1 hypothetical protein [Allokutzneria sp. A3M-2-11 16]
MERGRVAVFLDGLDEMPEAARAPALQALSEQATFRLVLLSRTAELADSARRHTLTSAVAVELRPLAAAEAARYLLRPFTDRPPRAWRDLADTLTDQPDSPLAQALTSPLRVTLVRDVYGSSAAPGPVDELMDTDRFRDVDAISRHLLEHTVPAAYTSRPGRPPAPYTVDTARRTLTHIARCLRAQDDNRDLTWWTVASWLPAWRRIALSVLGGMLLSGLVFGTAGLLLSGFQTWPGVWFRSTYWFALILGAPASLAVALAFNLTQRRRGVVTAAASGVGVSLVLGLVLGGWALSVSTFGLTFAVAYGVTARNRGAAAMKSLNVGRGLTSARRVRSAVLLGLAFGLADGAFGTVAYLVRGVHDLSTALGFGLNGLLACLLIVTPVLWSTGAFVDDPASASTHPADPVQSWRGDFRLWSVVGVASGVISGINAGLAYQAPVYGFGGEGIGTLADVLVGGVCHGLVIGVILGRAWMTTVTQVWFAVRYRTPPRLMRFLEDSRERHLLRAVGSTYQFRHATFQDHLADS